MLLDVHFYAEFAVTLSRIISQQKRHKLICLYKKLRQPNPIPSLPKPFSRESDAEVSA